MDLAEGLDSFTISFPIDIRCGFYLFHEVLLADSFDDVTRKLSCPPGLIASSTAHTFC